MAESSDQNKKTEESSLDLSGLSSISLGPDWVSGKKRSTALPRENRDQGRSRPQRGPSREPRKDRRGAAFRRPDRQESGGRYERPERAQPFEPVIAADFYPEEEPFKVLGQAIRNSYRTFELFEIARLILEKPDRFVCVVRDPAQKEGETALLHASVPDGLPFKSEEEALSHAVRHYMGEFFNLEEVEGEAPSGAFQVVHKCGMTGELLAPPNYHRYQAICREHHASKLAHVSYSKFEQSIESSREEEDIQKWLEQMKTQTRFTWKENSEIVFNNREDARLYLVTEARDKLVRPAYSARFSGKALALLNPQDPIRRSVEYLAEGQRRFPLDTANHLRGRLRRMHFAVYKRGSKGISYVCAVKRRFRKPDEVLADNLQELIDFLEAHPNFPLKDLPKAFLGIDPAHKPDSSAAEAAKDVAEEVAKEIGEPEVPVPAPVAKKEVSEAEQSALKQLKIDLHYLVSEGYVTEFSDGRLFVPPIREDEIRHSEKEKQEKLQPTEEPPKPEEKAEAPEKAAEPEKAEEPEKVAEPEKVEAVEEVEPEPSAEKVEAPAKPEPPEIPESPDAPASPDEATPPKPEKTE
ncbi:hypothetical protein G0Q06_09570 [Puniceicoccales bacterium CK1056]|uniref:Uncharacterized protein n=1 Tax=Oceanipulchritudo coccoides TaxID=2706888 RepID=A0A6B2M3N7_9BACT|nr:hypothetical protein [Oceanipulchritudo coccoides]NDV62697.1 hypothetical protein [Oceanipulchritudo coccoides]